MVTTVFEIPSNNNSQKHYIVAYFLSLKHVFTLLIFCVLFPSSALADTLTASVDRNQLGSGETFELRLKYDGQTTSDPDLSPLEEEFEVLSKHQQNQYSFMNGTSVSYTEWRIQLLPKKSGKLTIPSLKFKGVSSKAITLQVTDRPTSGLKNQPVYVEAELDKNSLYVQEQLLLTLRVLSTTNLQGISSEDLVIENAYMTKVAENQFQKQINGINHLVIELKYAIFPNTSGQLTIPALRFNVVLPDRRDPYSSSFFSRGGKRIFLYSEEQDVTVKPRPTNYGTGEWLPSKGVSLTERWSRPLDELVAGEPITRTISFTAQGSTSAQLPPLEIKAGNGFKTYPDQPQLNDEVNSNGVTATRMESIAIVPSRGGQLTLPPITVKWWDTTTNQVRETTLEATTLTVKPAATTTSLPTTPLIQNNLGITTTTENNRATSTETTNNSMLLWLLAISNLILLVALAVLFTLWKKSKGFQTSQRSPQLSQTTESEQKESILFKQLKQAAKKQDQKVFREALLAWASSHWQQPFVTLDQITTLANIPSLKEQLKGLDYALYSDDSDSNNATEINLIALVDELKKIKDQNDKKTQNNGNHLKPLYSEGN